ncbi:MAG TPA: HAMP domain-containing sensor histidine kinase [Candidatus Thermoplasmatota archaeon]|nr:HAMP domain-containing sensor histidine kinase [Candidatus Thermoplasmatota archaeon]
MKEAKARTVGPLPEVDQLQLQNAFKTQLLNSVAHELSTPLTPIRLQLHTLMGGRAGALTVEQQRCLTVIDRNIERLHGLVKNILDVSRLEAQHFKVEMKAVDLAQIVTEAYEAYRDAAREAGVELRAEVMAGAFVMADSPRLIQVAFNLLSNAIKFTPKGGTIHLGLAKEGPHASVTVRDNGVGFDPADQAKLFKPFSQLGGSVAAAYQGSGLGLYISDGIVALHGGSMWGESPGQGKGAEFGFRLPLVATQAGAPPVPLVMRSGASSSREAEFADRIRSLV